MRHVLLVVVSLGALLFAALALSATADSGLRPKHGIVPPKPHQTAGTVQGSGDLTYHGGAVMRTITTYAVYWRPSGTSFNGDNTTYQNTINQFFTDVATDSGLSSNVYATDPQYYDTIGGGTHHIAYSSTFAGSIVDTNPFPSDGCTDGIDTHCLTEDQLTTELQSVVEGQGWPENGSTQYFLFTPKNVGSCGFGDCAYQDFCAYHDSFSTGGGNEIIWADQPWTANWPSAGSSVCDEHQYPNSSDADPTINVMSHENNEAITDPNLDAWYDAAGYENGDKCAWTFGSLSGTSGHFYNQTINGHHYLLQEEYNNAGHNCVQNLPAAPVNSAAPTITGTAAVGQVLTANAGTWTHSPTSYTYQWQRCNSSGASCASLGSAVTTASLSTTRTLVSADGGQTIRVQVTASNGATGSPATSDATGVVDTGLPANSSPATITGTATVGQTLTGTAGSWTRSPSKYTYVWQRCDSGGASCATITTVAKTAAVSTTYKLVATDDKHTIRLSVSAINTVGTSPAYVTGATSVVNGEPVYSSGVFLSGTATVGQTLTAHAGTWLPTPTKYTYQWKRCDSLGNNCTTSITSSTTTATNASYKLAAADDRHTVAVVVIAVNAAGNSTPQMSSASGVVNGEPINTVLPSITGTAIVGQTLTAHAGTWANSVTKYTYLWQRCDSSGNNCTTISSTSSSSATATYKSVAADHGHTIRVTVTATNSAGASDTKQSAATSVVP
jgi:hypothetical protein